MTIRFLAAAPGTARAKLASTGVLADGWLVLPGILPVDLADDRVPLPEQVEMQTAKVLANLETLAGPLGLGRAEVVEVRIALVDLPRLEARMTAAYRRFFAENPPPALSLIGVAALPRGALVQMDFVLRRS